MNKFLIFAMTTVAVVAVAILFCSTPYEVQNDAGVCLHEVHPKLFSDDILEECNTTGPLGLGMPLRQ